jgi:hypothetical protein
VNGGCPLAARPPDRHATDIPVGIDLGPILRPSVPLGKVDTFFEGKADYFPALPKSA